MERHLFVYTKLNEAKISWIIPNFAPEKNSRTPEFPDFSQKYLPTALRRGDVKLNLKKSCENEQRNII